MNKQQILVGYGKATFPHTSVTIAGFAVEAPFVRTLASKKLTKIGATNRMPVSAHPDIDGWLYSETIDVPDGTILLIQTSRKFRGSGLYDGALFIRARKDGDALLISAHIPPDARCTLPTHQHVVFSGNGDILTVEDLDAEGIEPGERYTDAFMTEEEVEEAYNIQVIAKARAPAPKIEKVLNDEGEEVKLNVGRVQRRMRIRAK